MPLLGYIIGAEIWVDTGTMLAFSSAGPKSFALTCSRIYPASSIAPCKDKQ